jgi:hypothetical protein
LAFGILPVVPLGVGFSELVGPGAVELQNFAVSSPSLGDLANREAFERNAYIESSAIVPSTVMEGPGAARAGISSIVSSTAVEGPGDAGGESWRPPDIW